MKLRGIEIAEEVKDVFKEGDFNKDEINSVREIKRLEDENYDWRIEFFQEGKKVRHYLPHYSTTEILEVYSILLKKNKSGFGLIYFSEIPEREI